MGLQVSLFDIDDRQTRRAIYYRLNFRYAARRKLITTVEERIH